jgi:hypothetical protein
MKLEQQLAYNAIEFIRDERAEKEFAGNREKIKQLIETQNEDFVDEAVDEVLNFLVLCYGDKS